MSLRVLHVIPGLDPRSGGVAMALTGLAAAQGRAGMNVRVLATFGAGEDRSAAEALRGAGVRVEMVGPCSGRMLRHRALGSALRAAVADAELVHVHALWEEPQHVAAKSARSAGVPYVFSPHGMLDPWSMGRSKWVKRLYMLWRLRGDLEGAAALHYTTPIERDLARRWGLGPRAIVEPNGLDMGEFERLPERGTFRARHGIAPQRPLVLFLSRIHPKKGLDLLIPAFARGGMPADTLLVVAGPDNDDYRPRVEKLVAEHGLGGRVIFPGMLRGPERIEAFVDADLFVLPSYQENFGIVVAEALACGTPVVISDQVNIHPEITGAGVGGVVPLEVGRLAEEMRRWMTDAALREAAAGKGRALVRERYDWMQIARRWGEHYGRITRRS